MGEKKIFPSPGERVFVALPWSEVCMHLRIAGRILPVELLPRGMAQVYDEDDRKLSFPITAGEAGFRFDNSVGGWYCYGHYASNPPAECEMPGCDNPACGCGSPKCYSHTHFPDDDGGRNDNPR